MSLKPIMFYRGDYIIKQGQIAAEMYFVARGSAEIVNELTEAHFGYLHGGSFFGEIGILLQSERTASVRCSSEVINVFKLSKKDLDRILVNFPEVSENIQREAKKRLENGNQLNKSSVNTDLDITRERLKNVCQIASFNKAFRSPCF